ncbi:MAG TPA: trypsin-like peptidase domain-containing protein [Myxococcota bacterium]
MRRFWIPLALAAISLLTASGALAADPWEATIDRVSHAVVAIRVSAVRAFDTEDPSTSVATGFVVDAERGLILTNRHVVQPGPVKAHAIFLNHEEVEVVPVYRDPVHDFGFYRYDPRALEFMQPAALELAPDAARVGVELRVIGNDSGEKLSILAGTLARLDRDAPNYGAGSYNDFNTFYLQAASGTSGGSSGSPVVDRRGRVIGLNAGGSTGSATSFYLPLDRPARALALIRASRPVTRGSLHTVFRQRPYYDLQRLGLRKETEARARRAAPGSIGMLVAHEIVPEGPADGLLEPGDIVVALDGKPLDGFVQLEDALDARVGQTVTLDVERGGEPLALTIPVGDLHAVTPASFLEMGGGVMNPLSLQLARAYAMPVRGVYLASAGYAFGRSGIPAGTLIEALDGAPIGSLAELEHELAQRADGQLARVQFRPLGETGAPRIGVLRVDRRWFPMQRCDRVDSAPAWSCRPSPAPPSTVAPPLATVRLATEGSGPTARLAQSLVQVRFDVALPMDGVQGGQFSGAGLVVDAERGLVITDRDTVPILVGDVELVIGGSAAIPGRVVALHPEHNLALVAYDPRLVGATPLVSAELDPRPLARGEKVWAITMTRQQELLGRTSKVERVDVPAIPVPKTPRFRETNLDLAALTDDIASIGGVLADRKGRVRALWASFSTDAGGASNSFFGGIPSAVIQDWIARAGQPTRTLGAELETLTLLRARERGLPDALAAELERADGDGRRVLAVRRLTPGTPAAEKLRVGDLVVREGGRPLASLLELERSVQRGSVSLDVVRAGELVNAAFEPALALPPAAERVVLWAGALLQEVPATIATQRGLALEGVYVAGRWRGTPAEAHELAPTWRILAVDGVRVKGLDEFLAVVASKPDGASLRLFVSDLDGRERVITLETDLAYWPTSELVSDGNGGWTRKP